MTSNVGSQYIREMAGQDEEEMRRKVMEVLNQSFPPEFLNRIDETIIFHALTRADLVQIVEIQVRRLQQLLAEPSHRTAADRSSQTAARRNRVTTRLWRQTAKRTIQRELQDPLAMRILEGQFHDGDSVEVDAEKRNFIFKKAERSRSPPDELCQVEQFINQERPCANSPRSG